MYTFDWRDDRTIGVIPKVFLSSGMSITNRVEAELMIKDMHGRSPSRAQGNFYHYLDTLVCVKLFCDFRTWGLQDNTWDEYEQV